MFNDCVGCFNFKDNRIVWLMFGETSLRYSVRVNKGKNK